MKETFAIEPGDGQQLGANFDGHGNASLLVMMRF